MVGFLCAGLGKIQPVWKNFGYFGVSSAKIVVAGIKLRKFDRFK
jgi:hypothetical protein